MITARHRHPLPPAFEHVPHAAPAPRPADPEQRPAGGTHRTTTSAPGSVRVDTGWAA